MASITDAAANFVLDATIAGADPRTAALLTEIRAIAVEEQATPLSPGEKPFDVRDLTPYLKMYRFVRKNPWVPYAVMGGVVLAIFGAGHLIGGRRAA